MKNKALGLLLVSALLVQSVAAVDASVVADTTAQASCGYCECLCPVKAWDNIKANPQRTALVVALAAFGVSFYTVYESDKTFVENLQNYPKALWTRLNNAIAGLGTSKKCY